MDETGTQIILGILSLGVAAAIAIGWWWRKQQSRIESAKQWPVTEATIESGKLERATEGRIVLPTFAFSYHVNGEYYAGRFSLIPQGAPSEDIIQRLVGRKLQIHYKASTPDSWFIAQAQIEGCDVEQPIGPHAIALYPSS
jgi:hypothetical protein